MSDVQERFNNYTDKISNLSKEGFSKISGEILSQLIKKGLPKIDNDFLDNINLKDIEIILNRVGEEISTENKEKIKEIVATKKVKSIDFSLLYFLEILIKIYDEQKKLDSAIIDFFPYF